MRIMHATSGGRTGNGALLCAAELAKRQASAGHDVWMLCPENCFTADQIAGSRVTHVPSPLTRWPLDEARRIRDFIGRHDIDLYHGHSSRAFNFGVLLRRLYGVPCVSTAQSNRWQLHWCMADYVIAVSRTNERFHRRFNGVRGSRSTMIWNPVDTERFRPADEARRQALRAKLGWSDDDLVLLCVASVDKRKGQRTLVEAMPAVVKRFPQARLSCVGPESTPYGQDLRSRIQQLGLRDKVDLVGAVANVEDYYAASDLGLNPSRDEPFGLAAVESLACGVPVIASRLGGFLETVQDSPGPTATGRLLPPERADRWSGTICELLESPDLRRAFGQAGRAWVQKHLVPEVHDAAVQKVYEQVLALRRPPR